MTNLMLAFVAGLVTILNPCVLPLVPLVVGSALSKSKFGPIALVIGLVASFTVVGLAVLSFGFALGIDEHIVRMLAGALLVLAGGFMLVPRLQLALSTAGAPISRMAGDRLDRFNQDSVAGQGGVGALLVLSIRVIASRSFWSRPWRDGHPAKANWPLDPALHSLRGLSLSVITASSSL